MLLPSRPVAPTQKRPDSPPSLPSFLLHMHTRTRRLRRPPQSIDGRRGRNVGDETVCAAAAAAAGAGAAPPPPTASPVCFPRLDPHICNTILIDCFPPSLSLFSPLRSLFLLLVLLHFLRYVARFTASTMSSICRCGVVREGRVNTQIPHEHTHEPTTRSTSTSPPRQTDRQTDTD